MKLYSKNDRYKLYQGNMLDMFFKEEKYEQKRYITNKI